MSNQRIKYFIASKSIIKLLGLLMVISWNQVFAQGYNHTWLLGYHSNLSNPTDSMARMDFSSSNYNLVDYPRKMPFGATQGNISDENGNFLMSSNGIWIANSMGDTMPNGTGLNPGWAADAYKSFGLPLTNANIILPMPNDSNKFVLFHQTVGSISLSSPEIFYTLIDKTLDNGKGDVISKNNVAHSGTFGHGMTACKHGNGRDWWVVAFSNNADTIYKFLLTSNNIQYVGFQKLNVPIYGGWAGQPVFSPSGEKFAYRNVYYISPNYFQDLRLFNFDRCDGSFTLDTIIDYTDSILGFGSSFSSNSKYLYVSSAQYIYQFNTDTSDIAASKTTVAVNDSFNSAGGLTTDFMLMYLAANGKIYITSGNSVLHLHEMDYPDSAGIACNVNLHNIVLNCLNFRTVPVHPNYYLGRLVGSPCDTLTGIHDLAVHDFKFSISPNPNNGSFKIMYLLPQNKSGTLQIFDITGKEIYHQVLPPWSTLQYIALPKIADGVYQCTITSNNQRVNKKLVVVE